MEFQEPYRGGIMRRFLCAAFMLLAMTVAGYGATYNLTTADSIKTEIEAGSSGDIFTLAAGEYWSDGISIPAGVSVIGLNARTATLKDTNNGTVVDLAAASTLDSVVVSGQYILFTGDCSFTNTQFEVAGDAFGYMIGAIGDYSVTTTNCNFGGATDNHPSTNWIESPKVAYLVGDTLDHVGDSCQLINYHASNTDSVVITGCYFKGIGEDGFDCFLEQDAETEVIDKIRIQDCIFDSVYFSPDNNTACLLEGKADTVIFVDNLVDSSSIVLFAEADLSDVYTFTGNTITHSKGMIYSPSTLASGTISNNSMNNGLASGWPRTYFCSLQADGTGLTIASNTLDSLTSIGFFIGHDASTLTGNTVVCWPDCTNIHPIVLGYDGIADDDDSYANGTIASGNTVSGAPHFATAFKNAKGAQMLSNTLGGATTATMFKSATECIFANNEFTSTSDGGSYLGAVCLNLQLGTTTATHSHVIVDGNEVLNNVFDGFSSSSKMYAIFPSADSTNGDTVAYSLNTYDNNVFIDYNTTIFADSTLTAGDYTLTEWLADANTNDDQSVFETSITTAQNNWQYWYGGAANANITVPYNWYPIGTTQRTQFPRVSNTETGPYFLRLEYADSLVNMYGATWAEDDIIIYPVFGGNQEKNAHRQYEIDRYIETGSDTLYVVPDNGTAVKVWK
jgi:hypothetical protein